MSAFAIPTDEQRALRETATAFLAGHANARNGRDGDAALWQTMAELGWPAVLVPEEFGGLGLGIPEAVVLLEEMGRSLTRSPFFATVALAQPLLLHAASEEACQRWLPGLAEGSATATVIAAPGVSPAFRHDQLAIRACRRGDSWALQGCAEQVLDGEGADMAFVVAALEDGECGLFHVSADTPGLQRSGLDSWDSTRPQGRWRFDGVQLPLEARIDRPAGFVAGVAHALQLAALMLAAEQVGGAARCLELTVAYTGERRQFGRPIAVFQAVKHRCAQMMVKLETARSALQGALAALELDEPAVASEIAVARVLATEAYRFCAAEAIQLHGGVGFTWEYDPQLHFKRAQWASHWFGDADAWRDVVADGVLGGVTERHQ